MYLNHFNLTKYPFGLTPDTEFAYNHQGHQAALNLLLFGLDNGEGVVVLTGEVGYGKTFLCRELLNYLHDPFVVVYLPNPDLTTGELKAAILRELSNKVPIKLTADVDIMQSIFEQLIYCNQGGRKVVILIDEAQALSEANLETLRLLTNIETESHKLLQIVLFGQPELQERLAKRQLRQLTQRIAFSHELRPLTRREIGAYLAQRLTVAGYSGGELFSKTAQALLFSASGGTLRVLNILAHKAMLAAYGKGASKVDCWAVRQAIWDSRQLLGPRLGPRGRLGSWFFASVCVGVGAIGLWWAVS